MTWSVQAAHDGGVALAARRHRAAAPACDSQEMTRRPTTSGAQAAAPCRGLRPIHSPTSCRAMASPSRTAPSRWRSQPKPCSSRAHAGFGRPAPQTASAPQIGDVGRRARSCRRRPRRRSSGRAAQVGRRQQQLVGRRRAIAASAAAASGACGPAPRAARAHRDIAIS